jgi:sulfonate transport system substrate-binding protein
MRKHGVSLLVLLALLVPLFGHGSGAQAAEKPKEIRIDYAYYNPSSLVLKKFGWLEEDLKADGIKVKWVLSAGSNKANEYLRSEAVDFGSTAGSAALLARTNGSPIQTVYIYSKPEWAAIVVPKDSDITTLQQLKGKKIAATKGTDPYFFLLQSLHSVGLTASDVQIVNLQHADGRVALERGQVDAWSGLDPFMAETQLDAGSKLIYRNIDFNTYGFLNARQKFLEAHADYVPRVLPQYERARAWILENPDDAAQILADEAKLSIEVAKKELNERTVLTTSPVPGEEHTAALTPVIPIFEAENQLTPGSDPNEALANLYAPEWIQAIVAAAATA